MESDSSFLLAETISVFHVIAALLLLGLVRMQAFVEAVELVVFCLVHYFFVSHMTLFGFLSLKLMISILQATSPFRQSRAADYVSLLISPPSWLYVQLAIGDQVYGWDANDSEESKDNPLPTLEMTPVSTLEEHVRANATYVIHCGYGTNKKIEDGSLPLSIYPGSSHVWPHLAACEMSDTKFLPFLSLYCLRWDLWAAVVMLIPIISVMLNSIVFVGRVVELVFGAFVVCDVFCINRRRFTSHPNHTRFSKVAFELLVLFPLATFGYVAFLRNVPSFFLSQIGQFFGFLLLGLLAVALMNRKALLKLIVR